MNAKHVVVVLLPLLLLCSGAVFAGGNAEDGTPVDTWSEGDEVTPEPRAHLLVWADVGAGAEYVRYAAERFTDQYRVEIEVQEISPLGTHTRLETDGPAGSGADVYEVIHNVLGPLTTSGLIMENLVSAEDIKANFIEAAIVAVSDRDGTVYGFPAGLETYALFYNIDIWPEPPKTLEELLSMGRTFVGGDRQRYGVIWPADNLYFSQAFIGAGGGYVFGNNGTDPTNIGLASDEAIAGIEAMVELKEISVQNTGDASGAAMDGLFQEGRAASIIAGPWSVAGAEAAGVDFGVAALPTIDGNPMRPYSGVRMYGVSTYSKYPRAAQLFAAFLTSREMLVERFRITHQIPPRRDLLAGDTLNTDSITAGFLAQTEYAVPMPSIPEMAFVWNPVSAALADIWNNGADVETAMNTAVRVIRDQIAGQ